jgi:hypothetical protein
VTLQLGDLSAAALQQAMQDTASGSLLWVFTFANGFTQSAASARYTEQDGFTFGYNDYTTGSAQCGSSGEKCVVFPGDQPIKGKVDQQAGTITLSVPRSYLRALTGPEGPDQRPTETKATPGSRFYDATTFTFGNASPGQSQQSFMYPGDSTRAMDFLLPGQEQSFPARPPRPATTPTATPTATPATGGAPACASGRALRSARARPRRGTVRMEFSRRESGSVTVDVFQVSAPGRRVLRPHLIARFANRDRSFTWNGLANRRGRTVRDGFYFARFRMRAPYGAVRDTRRVALRRSHGRFSVRPRFDRPESCATLKLFKLDAPAFGGSRNRALRVAYRLTRQARVTLTVLRGKRVVRRYGTRTRAANRTFRTRFASRGRPRGDYRFRLQVVRGKSRTTVTLASRNV